MTTVILAGLTKDHVQRIKASIRKGEESYRPSWQVEYFFANNKGQPGLSDKDIEYLLRKAEEYGGAHIIGISKQDGAIRNRIRDRILRHFRFIWLDNVLLSHVGSNAKQFICELNRVLEEECLWERYVKPNQLGSPLILPESCFYTSSRVQNNIWNLSEQYGDAGNIIAAAKAIETFSSSYWRTTSPTGHYHSCRKWIDDNDYIFDHQGERHGDAPFPRNWKYSFHIEDGFHFDVSELNGKRFSIKDCNNKVHSPSLGGHVNLDSHGWSI